MPIPSKFSQNTFHPESIDTLAQSFIRIGIGRFQAYKAAHFIWEQRPDSPTCPSFFQLALCFLKENHPHLIPLYKNWKKIIQRKKPLIILLGGATGVGKSTIAQKLAHILSISHIVCTDSVREVLRGFHTPSTDPILNVSSYQAGKKASNEMGHPISTCDGFLKHSQKVFPGIKSIFKWAFEKNTDVIIEGVHLVPGCLKHMNIKEDTVTIVQIILDVDHSEVHKNHFFSREKQMPCEKNSKYLSYFSEIRTIQELLRQKAEEHNIPRIQNYDIQKTERDILNIIYKKYFPPFKSNI